MKRLGKRMGALLLALSLVLNLATASAAELSAVQTDGNAFWGEEAVLPEEGSAASAVEGETAEAEPEAEEEEEAAMSAEAVGEAFPDEGEADEAPLNCGDAYFSKDELFLYVGKSVAPKMSIEAPEGATYTSSDEKVVTVNKETGKLKSVGLGKSTVTLWDADGETKLDSLAVYGYHYSTFTKTETKNTSAPLKVEVTTGDVVHEYKTFNQKEQYDEGGHKLTNLSSHGCGISSTAELAQGFGLEDVTPVWMQQEALPQEADELGITLGNALGADSGSRPLGFYGMQYTLANLGISSKIYTWTKDSRTKAVKEMTKALSEGRPLIVVVYKYVWGGIQLTSQYHFLLLTGIDKDGNVIFLNTSNGKVQYAIGATRKLTVSQLVNHFIRPDSKQTNLKDFFYYQPTGSGCMACLEVTSNDLGERKLKPSGKKSITKGSVSLSKTSYTYSGGAKKPTATLKMDGKTLKEGEDFTYWHNNNITAGSTAVVTLRGKGDYTGLMQKKFTINRADNTITLADQNLTGSTKEQTLQLSAKANASAAVTYSTKDKEVTVSSAGKVTIPANYGGKAVITATSAQTTNYKKTTKDITVTVTEAPNVITASDQTVTASAKEQTVQLSAKAKGSAKLTYTTTEPGVQVSSAGKVTIPARFSGKVPVTITAAKTTYYKKATKTINLTVKATENTLTAEDRYVAAAPKEQTLQLSASALDGAVLTFATTSKDITLTPSGKVTIPANYAGTVKITVTAAATGVYLETQKTLTLTVTGDDGEQPALPEGLQVEDQTVYVSSKKQTVQMKAAAPEGTALTFACADAAVTVDEAGAVTLPAGYAGAVTITVTAGEEQQDAVLTVKPKAVKLSSVKNSASKAITGKWTKNAVVTGYEFQYSTVKDFSKVSAKKSVAVKGASNVSQKVSKLKKGTKYYCRVRCYKAYNGRNYSSDWSKTVSVTVKK